VAYDGAVRSAVAIPEERVLRFADGRIASFDEVVWLPPVEPRTTFALGLNYADHAAELSFKASEKPLIFLKGPNVFVGHHGSSVCPNGIQQMHPECELGVVIGRTGRHINRDDVFDHVAGYTVANDYALREYLENYYRPNFRVKNRDGCTPLGPWMVDASDVSDPTSLGLRTLVNGEVVQQGNTRDMIFDIPAIIEYLSDFMTLSQGDLILTGTPQGVRYVKTGDEVVTEIEQVGRLINRIIDETDGREVNRNGVASAIRES
jgi:5-oxopent-3-ene-1,2,5-tricarboxylate decarboxylase/2-hydroxyhepta-2,4-diene-1,7-dioate isomerase